MTFKHTILVTLTMSIIPLYCRDPYMHSLVSTKKIKNLHQGFVPPYMVNLHKYLETTRDKKKLFGATTVVGSSPTLDTEVCKKRKMTRGTSFSYLAIEFLPRSRSRLVCG